MAIIEHASEVSQILVVALVGGVLAQVLGVALRLPSIIFLLLIGVALGPEGLGLVQPSRLGTGLEVMVRLGVAFILFEGSMALRLHEILKVQKAVRLLITFGMALTFLLASLAAWAISGLPGEQACVFGALVSVTGPTVIRPILRRVKVRSEVAAVLEGEAILADPLGAVLCAVCLEYALAPGATPLQQAQEFGVRILAGAGIGAAVGFVAGWMVKRRAPPLERIKPLLVLACALGGYTVAELARRDAGIMAVVACGLAIQHGVAAHDRDLREFKELITNILLSVLFVLLSAAMPLNTMAEEGLPGLLTVLVVVLVIRPVNVFACTWGSGLSAREKGFLSWVAPRGIVAASVASLGAILLERQGYAGAHRVESLVFLTVFLTVLAQGSTASAVARALGITVKEARAILVVGANFLARRVAQAYHRLGKRVVVIDRNPALVAKAREAGLEALLGDATDRDVLVEARLSEADVFIGLTSRTSVNQAAARLALHEHHLEQVWVAMEETAGQRKMDPLLSRAGAELALGRPLPLDGWLSDLDGGRARVIAIDLEQGTFPRRPLGEVAFPADLAPLLVERQGRVELARSSLRLEPGDRLELLSRLGTVEEAKAVLARLSRAKVPPPGQTAPVSLEEAHS